jgi:branched-chain amino acid transport system permease protein
MNTLAFILTQCVNALSQAALLFFLGCGLTLIFGIMRIVNFAHGSIYMLGAYVGYTAARLTGSFVAALVVAPIVVAIFGLLFELFILRRLYGRDGNAFLMVTFGLALILGDFIQIVWGAPPLQVLPPPPLAGVVFFLDEPFPVYRLFLIGFGIAVAITIWQFLERTRLGLLIRATSQNPEMVHALGTDVNWVRSGVFGMGCAFAAVVDAFVIVIIGGMGSFLGSLLGALIVAFVQVFGNYYVPEAALAFMYLVMLTVLVVRPGGLLGKEA